MSDELVAAPLLRGLLIDLAAEPVSLGLVSADDYSATGGAMELRVDRDKILGPDGHADEEKLAAELKAKFAAKRASMSCNAKIPDAIVLSIGDERFAYKVSAPCVSDGGGVSGTAMSRRDSELANSAYGRSSVVAGKVALVTGGAQGIGGEIVRGLAASGATVFIADLNYEGARELSDVLNAGEPRSTTYPVAVNVMDEKSVEAMFDTVARTTGGLDLVVSNAGVLKAGSVLELDEKSFRFVTDVNYIGFFLMVKHAGALLRRQWRTAPVWYTDIVQINSKSGLEGSNKNGAYAGSKFGSIGLVQSFALELVKYHIKVNAICPGNFLGGPLWTDPVKGLFVQYLNSGKVPGAKTVEDVRLYYESKVPMGRGVEGKDLMRALYYLVEQEYETGQALPVTGGQVMLS
ncbi:MAG: SDR family oxidoreductase [Spirochaetaceae bacterium]|nr:SDR family oxidoreductase [Spirochaetaceae bacterium]